MGADSKSDDAMLNSLLLGEFAIFAVLSVLQKFFFSKSNWWCSYKSVVIGLLVVDTLTLPIWIAIPFLGPITWLSALQEVLVILVVVAGIIAGWYSAIKDNTRVMYIYQVCLILRLLYLVAQIPIWHFLDSEFDPFEKLILKLCLMPYMMFVMFCHTMANELRKELEKSQAKKDEKAEKKPKEEEDLQSSEEPTEETIIVVAAREI